MKRFRIGRSYHNYIHPREPRYVSLNATHQKQSFSGIIKVITYNIKLSRKTHKALKLLTEHNELNNADIICLQEMDPHGVDLIARKLNYNFVYYPAILHPRNDKDFGNAVLSKWPILNDEKIILPKLGGGKLQRIAVSATLSINNIKVMVFSVHMKVFVRHFQRRIPIDRIIGAIEPSVEHCIIAGDFNTFSRSNRRAILKPFNEANFQFATNNIGWTYKHWYLLNKKSTLDYIFARAKSSAALPFAMTRRASSGLVGMVATSMSRWPRCMSMASIAVSRLRPKKCADSDDSMTTTP